MQILKRDKVKAGQSCLTLVTLCTIQSMGFSRPEYWSGQPFSYPGDLPNPGIEPRSPVLQAILYQLSHTGSSVMCVYVCIYMCVCVCVLCVCVLVAQLCPTLCDPIDCSPPDSSVHGVLQARILECVAISFSKKRDEKDSYHLNYI